MEGDFPLDAVAISRGLFAAQLDVVVRVLAARVAGDVSLEDGPLSGSEGGEALAPFGLLPCRAIRGGVGRYRVDALGAVRMEFEVSEEVLQTGGFTANDLAGCFSGLPRGCVFLHRRRHFFAGYFRFLIFSPRIDLPGMKVRPNQLTGVGHE